MPRIGFCIQYVLCIYLHTRCTSRYSKRALQSCALVFELSKFKPPRRLPPNSTPWHTTLAHSFTFSSRDLTSNTKNDGCCRSVLRFCKQTIIMYYSTRIVYLYDFIMSRHKVYYILFKVHVSRP